MEKIFGWSLLLAVFVMTRFLAVSWPRGGEAEESAGDAIRVAIETAQHLLSHLSITDLPAIIGATLASEPLLALLLAATVGLTLCLSSFPGVMFGDDLIGWRGVLMLLVSVASVLGAVFLAPGLWKALLSVAVVVVGWALVSWWGRGSALTRWNRYATALLERRDARGRVVDWRTGFSLEDGSESLRFRQVAEMLVARSAYVHEEMTRRHDDSLEDSQVTDAYLDAIVFRRVLTLEDRARRRGRILEPERVKRSFTRRERLMKARYFVLTRGIVLAGALVIISLAATPTSWIAPTCLTDVEQSRTVYILSSSPPTVLVDATRMVETRTSWSGVELMTGACDEAPTGG